MRITEGRLTERECPDCGGVERRAFGESVSHRGELASYAFGWTSGHEDRLGHLTVGIGAGNEGGGSFHADIHVNEDGHGFTLVDRPFEAPSPCGSSPATATSAPTGSCCAARCRPRSGAY